MDLGLVERLAERLDGRLHARRVEGAGDVERQRALAALAGGLLGLLERVAVAGEDDLAGRVVVGDGDAGLGRDGLGVLEVGAHERQHRAGVVGLGHQLAAQDDEVRARRRARARRRRRARRARRASGRRRPRGRDRGRPSRRGWRRRWRAAGSGSTRRRAGRDPHPRALRSARAARARAPRRGLACRVSGCPGQGKARPGQKGRWSSSHVELVHGVSEVTASGPPNPPAGGCASPRAPWPAATRSIRAAAPSGRLPHDSARPTSGKACSVCSLIVCGDRYSRPAISRLVAPEAIASKTSRSRSESGGPCGASWGRNTVMPSPTIRTAPAMSAAGQSLEMNPAAPAARAALGEIRPAPEIISTLVCGEIERSRSQISAPDSWPTNRSTSATCGSYRRVRRDRLVRVARAHAPLDPRLLAEHQPEPPVHDLMVVDDQHAQAPLAAAACAQAARVDVRRGQAAPPVALATSPARALRTRRSRPPATPPARPAAAPSRSTSAAPTRRRSPPPA